MSEPSKIREEASSKQKQVSLQWRGIATKYPQAYQDLIDFLNNMEEMYITYGKERAMPGPDGKKYTIDDHTISALLQGARVCGIVTTYIRNRVDLDVAQPITTKK